jgi:L-aspartate oxidase
MGVRGAKPPGLAYPIVIIGSGLAGLTTALSLAPIPVIVLAKSAEPASAWAQGGIAAAIGPDDSVDLHAGDTLAAGDSLCDQEAVRRIVAGGPALIDRLTRLGVRFDRYASGAPRLGLEAAHARRRIVHAGDATGDAIMRAVLAAAHATPSITFLSGEATRLELRNGAIAGVSLRNGTTLPAAAVVLATGGVGGLFAHTTNPRGAWGQGLALAARAGAVLADMEFVQFHPTALDTGRDPMRLVSEAVRGEGAVLIDETGHRFMAGMGSAELEPRDVVARAVWARLSDGHRVFLDARTCLGPRFAGRFPAIARFCVEAGIDPATAPIPVRPAAHYHMGGVAVDGSGRSTVPGLYACGECASTGLHGANRLASNSLLEAGVCGAEVATAIQSTALPGTVPLPARAPLPAADVAPVREIVSACLGVLRDQAGLDRAIAALLPMARSGGAVSDPALVGLCIAVAARRRRESRGAHTRTDFPAPGAVARRSLLTLEDVLARPGDDTRVAA